MRAASSYFLWLAIPLLTAIYQASAKYLALHMQGAPLDIDWFTQAAHTPWALSIIICEVLSFVLWLTILADTSLSKAVPVTAVAYMLILLMSWLIFHEPVMPLQLVGAALILAGVWCVGTASDKQGS